MGTKRPSWSLFDTLSNINISDYKIQSGGRISRDPSPRPASTAQSERERDSKREDDRRSERETEKKRDKARKKDMDPRDRHYERDRAPGPQPREGEREWRERERRQADERSRNGRPLSHLEKETAREVERAMSKGGTFPRARKRSADRGKGKSSTPKVDEERGERRQRDGPNRVEPDERERERERAWQRERYRERERDEMRGRGKEEGKNTVGRPVEDDKSRKRERYQESVVSQDRVRERGDSRDRRERDAGRKREKPRPRMGEREVRAPSPRNPRDIYSDKKDREMTQSREGRRDTRSEGDSDERELKRERGRDKEKQELTYHHSRSEGDDTSKTLREKDPERQLYREEDRQRYRDGDREGDRARRKGGEKDGVRYRDVDRRAVREGDRLKEHVTDLKYDKREGDRSRQYEQRTGRKVQEREVDQRWNDKTEGGSPSRTETAPRVPPRVQSSGEWSSDMDGEVRSRRGRDGPEERVSGRESTAESDKDVEEQRNPAAEKREKKRSEGQERDGREMREQRKMWLEPQRGKNSKDEVVIRERHTRGNERRSEEERSIESQAEFEREGRRVKEEPDEKDLDQSSYRASQEGRDEHRGDTEGTKGASLDVEDEGKVWREVDKGGKEHQSDSDGGIEGSWRRDAEGESVTDNTEESDGEEEGEGYSGFSENKGGSETGWRQEEDRMTSGEDGFVTVSSGGDDEEEEEEKEEEEFKDCPEFCEGAYDGRPPVAANECEEDEEMGKEEEEADEEREKQPKYVFCVIGQTAPPQGDPTGGQERDDPNAEGRNHCGDAAAQHRSPGINIRDAESETEPDPPREDRPRTGETAAGDVRHGAAAVAMRSKVEHPYAEIGTVKRDSQTEQLLNVWREKNRDGEERKREQTTAVPSNPYGDVCSIMEGINPAAMSPEEVEAIRIRMSGAWSMSEEPKRHSQAPHLKWAKDVVREILGRSEDHTVDEPNAEGRGNRGVDQCKTAVKNENQQEETAQVAGEVPVVMLETEEKLSWPDLEEEEPLDGQRGMGQRQNGMHADQFTAMHAGDTPTHTHADTLLDTEEKEDHSVASETELEEAAVEEKHSEEGDEVKLSEVEKEARREKEVQMYLSVSNTLYKPNSCPILNYDSESDLLVPFREGGQELEDGMSESEEERQEEEQEERGTEEGREERGTEEEREEKGTEEEQEERGTVEEREERGTVEEQEERGTVEELGEGNEVDSREGEAVAVKKGATVTSSCSFRDLGPEARLRRRGIRKTTERRDGELVEVEEEGNVGRDRRTRIFSTTGKQNKMEEVA
ncbi:hypothetical protein EYF80_008784 [Liparis tanakae]|uniref:Trichohyalin-like n=1 Tax=Liparis tanakae TaxID=230148 RepID=A0A4Z2IU65_9TELE|nr:hypothetical protein EYF80_008784 [Liparis tanakae]